jgi:4-hydroxy-2-oxoheptanedioate aldolase
MTTNGTRNGPPPVDTAAVAELGMMPYRAPSLLQPHRVREALADAHAGKIPPLVGFFCGLSCPPVAKVVAQLGYDIVFVDWEHASTNVETMTQASSPTIKRKSRS